MPTPVGQRNNRLTGAKQGDGRRVVFHPLHNNITAKATAPHTETNGKTTWYCASLGFSGRLGRHDEPRLECHHRFIMRLVDCQWLAHVCKSVLRHELEHRLERYSRALAGLAGVHRTPAPFAEIRDVFDIHHFVVGHALSVR